MKGFSSLSLFFFPLVVSSSLFLFYLWLLITWRIVNELRVHSSFTLRTSIFESHLVTRNVYCLFGLNTLQRYLDRLFIFSSSNFFFSLFAFNSWNFTLNCFCHRITKIPICRVTTYGGFVLHFEYEWWYQIFAYDHTVMGVESTFATKKSCSFLVKCLIRLCAHVLMFVCFFFYL